MKEIEGYVDPVQFTAYVRDRFMSVAASFERPAFDQLRDEIYPSFLDIYKRLGYEDSVFIPTDQKFRYESGLTEITERIQGWQTQWHLIESESSDKWVTNWVINFAFKCWARTTPSTNQPASSFLFDSLLQSHNHSLPLPFPIPKYIEMDSMTTLEFRRLSKEHYLEFCELQLRNHLKNYLKLLEHEINFDEWKKFEDVSIRDLAWTVQSQLSDISFSELSEISDVEPYLEEQVEPGAIIDLSKHKISTKKVEPSTVKRAVEKTLCIIGIQPRKKQTRKRPKRPVNPNIVSE